MPNPLNSTRCLVCNVKLVKNGRTAAGTQRWKCPTCGVSSNRKRADVSRKAELRRFLTWLLGKSSQAEIDGLTGRSFRDQTAWCWRIRPTLPAVTIPPRVVIIDGTYLADHGLLIATDEHQMPLAWQWCARESEAAWAALLRKVPAPLVVVCDGGSGVHAALRNEWPHTLVQRCIFHVWMNLKTHLTLKPRTPAGQTLLGLGRRLLQISTTEEATRWLQLVNDWWVEYGHLTKERTYAKRRTDGSWDSPTGQRWWYTHERLRRAYNLIASLIQKQHLFTYLEADCPKTTSRLEGGINHPIKETLRLHRGMTNDHQMRAAEWVLLQRARLLETAHDFITTEVLTPRSPQRPRHTEPEPGPALYDTGISDEEGLWTRTGWAGRA